MEERKMRCRGGSQFNYFSQFSYLSTGLRITVAATSSRFPSLLHYRTAVEVFLFQDVIALPR